MIQELPIMLFHPLFEVENHIWITARHKKIPVKSMSTIHIQNCINCLNGTGNMIIQEGYLGGKEKWIKIFTQELISRN